MEDFFKNVWQMIVDSNVLNLIGAILVLLVGWLIAVIVSSQVAKLVNRIGVDQKLNRCLPQGSELKEKSTAKFVGRFVYYLILLLTILGCLTTQTAEPIQEFVASLTSYAAKIIGAVALAFIAWVVATVLRYGSNMFLQMIRFDERFAKLTDEKENETPLSATVASILYWVVLLFFLPSILNVLEIKGITEPIQQMFSKILGYIPNLIAAAAILFVGLLAAKVVRKAVTGLIVISRVDALGELDVKVLAAGRGSDGQGLRELDAHAPGEAVADGEGQLRAADAAVDRLEHLEVAEEGEAVALRVLDAQARELLDEREVLGLRVSPRLGPGTAHLRSSQITFSTPKVGHTPQPTQLSRVQSGVVTPCAARRHSRCRNPFETPGEVWSHGSRASTGNSSQAMSSRS